ncbi:hypothetical protein Drose_01645 [Dactylosporangium roseum]|uniref:Uncharacterized protein n=1 Tax=Dactylosporangium roseum TaxID=47989 RepID=A0ABY5Z4S9_9ACTN|nr:hypothetical protein [Dactylosporangium roseum]UWZ37055.1 hypothetical protein Drose_01645 [Dactylosporangium roseum]
MLSAHGKALISREDYIRYAKDCPGVTGMAAQVTDARLETPEKAVVVIKVLGFTVSTTMVYERGAWAWEPSPEQTVDWSKPLDQRIAEGKASGSCGTPK